ncbi:MAG: hypothetical protein J2P25_04245 [Nocardiopsaceae bacterium]|nr:hypothetical protein [Nocardiopsaceae bacterium]
MLRRWYIPLAALTVTGGAAVAATAGTASASPAPANSHVNTAPAGVRQGGAPAHLTKPTGPQASRGGISHATSTNWSGYAANGSTYSKVSASWVQPTATCSSGSQYSSFWVGLDGYSSNSVEQDGTDSDCSGGSPSYYGWYEMYPNPSHNFGNTVKPGDTMSASVTHNSGSSYTLVLNDETAGWSATEPATLSGAPNSSAEVIIEAPSSSSGVLPLADFGTVNFSNSQVDGAAIGNDSPTEITMTNSSGADKDTVSSLSGGENFSATWKASN